MINYTTPTISLTVEGIDLTEQDIYVSLEQVRAELTKKGDSLTVSYSEGNTNITFDLSQEESAMFKFDKPVEVQVNWISVSGVRAATEIKTIGVMRNLLDKVIEYGD